MRSGWFRDENFSVNSLRGLAEEKEHRTLCFGHQFYKDNTNPCCVCSKRLVKQSIFYPCLNILPFDIRSMPPLLETLVGQCLITLYVKFHVSGLCGTGLNYEICVFLQYELV